MAKIEVMKCDRCGTVEEGDGVTPVIMVADDIPVDLCEGCAGELAAFLGGRPLRRVRKTADE